MILDTCYICLQCLVAQALPKYWLIEKLMKGEFLIFRFQKLDLVIT